MPGPGHPKRQGEVTTLDAKWEVERTTGPKDRFRGHPGPRTELLTWWESLERVHRTKAHLHPVLKGK